MELTWIYKLTFQYMNKYEKFVPNVWLVKTTEQKNKWDIIEVENKYWQTKEHVIHNLIKEKDGFFFYSITRADWYDARAHEEKKAEKLRGYAGTAQTKSEQHWKNSERDRDFLSLGEPIKIGHHSEKRHRAAIDYAWNQTGKAIELQEKAAEYENRAEYWDKQADRINLSMPESIEYYTHMVEKTTKVHEEYKNGTRERVHSYSLTYANNDRKEAEKNLKLAKILWE